MRDNLAKLPPQATDIEEGVLGSLILERDSIYQVIDILKPESFYKEEHQKIYKAISQLHSNGTGIDLMMVTQQLRKNNDLESVGGAIAVTNLVHRVGSSAHLEFHTRVVKEQEIRRDIIKTCVEIESKAYNESVELNDVLDVFYKSSTIGVVSSNSRAKRLSEIAVKRLKEFETIQETGEKHGIPSGWNKLDRITGNFQNKNLIILAGRPGQYKSKTAQEICKNGALQGKKYLIFSLEMSDSEYFDRELSSETDIEQMYLRQGDLKQKDWERIDSAMGRINDLDIWIDEQTDITIDQLVARAKMYKHELKIDCIVIDYLQLISSPEYRKFREREVSDISFKLKTLAKTLNIPVIALSQLNRQIESRADKKPNLGDLRESGSLEQDADVVIMLYRPEYYGSEFINRSGQETGTKDLIIADIVKHRNGATGEIFLWKTNRSQRILENKQEELDF